MSVYHFEIRKFPKALTRYNQTGEQVGAVAMLWVQERIIELNDQKWSPHEATITILQGPEIPIERLSMGRGWRTVQREGEEVTERVLQEAREELARRGGGATGSGGGAAITPAVGASSALPNADPLALGVELAGLLGPEAPELLRTWRAVAGRTGGLAPSESLALAERELKSAEEPR